MTSPRTIRPEDRDRPRPIYAVWEITLRCDHACEHCGSRAGPVRDDELSTAELLEVADALARLGTREVTLIGGEAYLRSDVYALTEHLAKQGVRVTMQTGGRGLTADRARRLRDAGMTAVGVSIDGTATVHDTLRASPGSHAAAMRAIEHARAAGLVVTSNSQVNRLNMHELPAVESAMPVLVLPVPVPVIASVVPTKRVSLRSTRSAPPARRSGKRWVPGTGSSSSRSSEGSTAAPT